jgi:DNA repair exonuclease SbcCD nuclease subunit
MRIQLISDVHLEFRNDRYPYIARLAPNIALLGDIGKPYSGVYRRFLAHLSGRFDRVLVIAGNHEYYSTSSRTLTVGEIQDQLRRVCGQFPNVYFLENSSMFIDGVRILACTLWTAIPNTHWQRIRRMINDYRMCYVSRYDDINIGVPLAPEHTTNWHEQSVTWLKEELAAPGYSDTPTIVLTHHAPDTNGTSDPIYANNEQQCAYSTDLTSLFQRPIVAWAYGHTHYPHDTKVRNVRLVSNPLGYPGELATEQASLRDPTVVEVHNTTRAPPPGFP